jgi:cytochrome c556
MMKPSVIVAVGIVVSNAALAHEGHEHATGVVRERMELMTDMGKRLLAISKRLRNKLPTAAKPVVWQQWNDFTEKAKKLEIEAEKLSTTTQPTVTSCASNSAPTRLRPPDQLARRGCCRERQP